jgi:hypothetical protein
MIMPTYPITHNQTNRRESMSKPTIPIDTDGNAFSIMGAARKAMRRAGVPAETIDKYTEEAASGDYDHLLQVTMRYVEFV